MAEIRPPENQGELFPGYSKQAQRPPRFPALAKSQKPVLISTTWEQILLATIIFILGLCLVFFLGVIRGKRLAVKPAPILAYAVSVPKTAPAQPAAATIPTPAPKTKTDAVSSMDPSKPYTIQLASFAKKEYAEEEMRKVRKSGHYSAVMQSGNYYTVCAGQYASIDNAKKDLLFFRSKYKDCYLRRR